MADCIVPGCVKDAQNGLSIRLRRPDTSAIWAPNLEAYVCDVHATSGARIEVLFASTDTKQVETHVHGVDVDDPSRVTAIRRPARLDAALQSEINRKVPQT